MIKAVRITLVLTAVLMVWRAAIFIGLEFIEFHEADEIQELGAGIIGILGDRGTIIPMIECLKKAKDNNVTIADNIIMLHNRLNMKKKKYMDVLVGAILDKKTPRFNRTGLIRAIEGITKVDFDCPGITKKHYFVKPSIAEQYVEEARTKEINCSVQKVREWWKENGDKYD